MSANSRDEVELSFSTLSVKEGILNFENSQQITLLNTNDRNYSIYWANGL